MQKIFSLLFVISLFVKICHFANNQVQLDLEEIIFTAHRWIWPLLGYLLETQGGLILSQHKPLLPGGLILDDFSTHFDSFLDVYYAIVEDGSDAKAVDLSPSASSSVETKGWRRRRDQARDAHHRGEGGNRHQGSQGLMRKPVPPNQSGPIGGGGTGPLPGGTGGKPDEPAYHDSPNGIIFQDPLIDENEPYHVRFLRVLGDVMTRWSQLVTMFMEVITEEQPGPGTSSNNKPQGCFGWQGFPDDPASAV